MPKFLAVFCCAFPLYALSCFSGLGTECGLLSSNTIVFQGKVLQSEIFDGPSPYPWDHVGPTYKVTFEILESLYGIENDKPLTIISPSRHPLNSESLVYAYRNSKGQLELPSDTCPTDLQSYIGLPERFLKYLREAKRLKLKNGALNIRAYNDFERTNGSPNIEVRIIGPLTRKGRSGPQGLIVFKDLPPGKYKVEATLGELTLVQEQTEVEVAPLSCNWFGAHLNYPRKNP